MPIIATCSWCHSGVTVPLYGPCFCPACGHAADRSRLDCDCPQCRPVPPPPERTARPPRPAEAYRSERHFYNRE